MAHPNQNAQGAPGAGDGKVGRARKRFPFGAEDVCSAVCPLVPPLKFVAILRRVAQRPGVAAVVDGREGTKPIYGAGGRVGAGGLRGGAGLARLDDARAVCRAAAGADFGRAVGLADPVCPGITLRLLAVHRVAGAGPVAYFSKRTATPVVAGSKTLAVRTTGSGASLRTFFIRAVWFLRLRAVVRRHRGCRRGGWPRGGRYWWAQRFCRHSHTLFRQ